MFNFSFDKRIIYIILGIMVLSMVVQYVSNPGMLISLLVSIPGVLIAITFHEFAHAFVADKLGDDTARREGRLSLNPFDHLDPIGTLLLLFAGFGWGKPVHVNPTNYTRKMSMEKGEALVSIAGPVMNFILALIFALIHCLMYKFLGETSFLYSSIGKVIMILISTTISINIGLGVFNLIPLPPLDGSKVIMPFLPYNAKQWFINNEKIFYIVFVLIWITGLAGLIISPVINLASGGILDLARFITGV
ncbi:MAG: site-2 protease family protein [Clostridia bacterium]